MNLGSEQFEALVEGMCEQILAFPHQKVAFWAPTTMEVILTLFAIWKVGKIACPLNTRLPSAESALQALETELFTPRLPQPKTPTPTNWDLSKLATFLFTSGSTGLPKIACHSLGNHVWNARGSNEMIPLESTDRWALTLPLFHVGGLGVLFRCYLAKCSVTFDRPDATHLSLVPTQLYRLLKEQTPLPHLKTILLGGAPLPNLSTPWNVLPTYGMTEMSSQIVTGHKVHPYAEVKISSDQEIWVRGATLFQGYYTQGKIACPLNEEGWFLTSDLGRWHEGQFQVIGRKDNLFISGGENIQPEEIEEAIRRHCEVHEAIVVPIADEEFGERPAVFLKHPEEFPKIQELLKPHIPKYKIPIRAFRLPPETGLKPNRKALKGLISTSLS